MVNILIEEGYQYNSRCNRLLEGILSVARKKRIAVNKCMREDKIEKGARIVILICASLKWVTDAIARLALRGIHPLLFGFQSIDTMYPYSCINLTYTKTTYLLARHLLGKNSGKMAFLGYNKDSMPDRLKLTGAEYAAQEAGTECVPFFNRGDILACIEEFAARAEEFGNIVCGNDAVAIILHNTRPDLCEGRGVCSCSDMKLGEYLNFPHATATIDYFKAGIRLSELYFFLEKRSEISSTFMTLEMDLIIDGVRTESGAVTGGFIYGGKNVDFYGDGAIREIELLENMLVKCDDLDMSILHRITDGTPYEQIAEMENLAINTVKYRIHIMLKNGGVSSKKKLLHLIAKYDLKF